MNFQYKTVKQDDLEAAYAWLDAATGYVNRVVLDQSTAVLLSFIALIAEANMVLVGPPGVAKSLLVRTLVRTLHEPGLEPVPFYQILMNAQVSPEELFGPFSIQALKVDQFRRVPGNPGQFISSATVAFLDEVFNAPGHILNQMLAILETKNRMVAGQSIPLQTVFAASNQWPDVSQKGLGGQTLAALRDRMIIGVNVTPPTPRVLTKIIFEGTDEIAWAPMPGAMKHLATLQAAAKEVHQTWWTPNMRSLFMKVLADLDQSGIKVSPRSSKVAAWVCSCCAVASKVDKFNPSILWPLAYSLNRSPGEEADKVQAVIETNCDTFYSAAKATYTRVLGSEAKLDQALETQANATHVSELPATTLVQIKTQITNCVREFEELLKKSGGDMRIQSFLGHALSVKSTVDGLMVSTTLKAAQGMVKPS